MYMDEMKKNPKKRKRVALIILVVVLALILALLVGGFVFGKSLLGKINRVDGSDGSLSQEEIDDILRETDPVDPNFTGPELSAEDVPMPSIPVKPATRSENIINILLVGQDRRAGQKRQRSDAMILCTINTEAKTLTMTSFMRDLWVSIPGKYNERLNVPYAIGGFPLLDATLESQFGVTVDHNIEVDFFGFTKLIDQIGGVTITISDAEAKSMNRGTDWNLQRGVNHLDGEQALAYARIRNVDNDFNRTGRQRTVLSAVVEKMRSCSIGELYAVADAILPMITTDMSDADIVAYLVKFAPMLTDLKISSQRVPMDGNYSFARIDGKSVLVMNNSDMEATIKMLSYTQGITE